MGPMSPNPKYELDWLKIRASQAKYILHTILYGKSHFFHTKSYEKNVWYEAGVQSPTMTKRVL